MVEQFTSLQQSKFSSEILIAMEAPLSSQCKGWMDGLSFTFQSHFDKSILTACTSAGIKWFQHRVCRWQAKEEEKSGTKLGKANSCKHTCAANAQKTNKVLTHTGSTWRLLRDQWECWGSAHSLYTRVSEIHKHCKYSKFSQAHKQRKIPSAEYTNKLHIHKCAASTHTMDKYRKKLSRTADNRSVSKGHRKKQMNQEQAG